MIEPVIGSSGPGLKCEIGVQKMFGHKRRTEIKQRAKLMGRMVMLLTDGAQNHTTNLSRAFPIRVTSRMKLHAMLEYRDSRCASRQAAGTRRPHRCTRTRNLGFPSRVVATIAVSS